MTRARKTRPPRRGSASRERRRSTSGRGSDAVQIVDCQSRASHAWWPPKVGDELLHDTQHPTGPVSFRRVEASVLVVAVFTHEGETRAVCAEWLPGRRRWTYDTYDTSHAEFGVIWPRGQPRPTDRD